MTSGQPLLGRLRPDWEPCTTFRESDRNPYSVGELEPERSQLPLRARDPCLLCYTLSLTIPYQIDLAEYLRAATEGGQPH